MRERSAQVLIDERAAARTKPLLAVLAKKLGLVDSRTDAMRTGVDALRGMIDEKIARIAAGELALILDDSGPWIVSNNPQPSDPEWDAKIRRWVAKECEET